MEPETYFTPTGFHFLSCDTIPRMDFSHITDDLLVGTTPSVSDYDTLRELGVRLIINMRFSQKPEPDPHHPPIKLLWLQSIDSPFFPLSIPKLVFGAQAALATIRDGGKVYAHCAYGRHRGPAMGACILIAQGYDPHDAMELIAARRSFADPFAFYIRPRILKFAEEWKDM
ncbi:MAG: dual specificity protein phosphatase [Chloroflexota bacterium]